MSNGDGLAFVGLLYIAFVLCGVGLSVYGIVLAFCASVLLGIIVLLTPPSGLIIGLVKFFAGIDLADKIVRWVTQ